MLLAAEIDGCLLDQFNGTGLFEHWQEVGFLHRDYRSGTWTLTGNGSWFINKMLKQMKEYIRASESNNERQ